MIINTYYSFSVLIYSVKMDFFKAFVLLEATKIIIRKNSKIKKKYFLFCWFCSKLKKIGGFVHTAKYKFRFDARYQNFIKHAFQNPTFWDCIFMISLFIISYGALEVTVP